MNENSERGQRMSVMMTWTVGGSDEDGQGKHGAPGGMPGRGRQRATRARVNAIGKRCVDLGCLLVWLPMVLPLMIAVAIWIKVVSRGPIWIGQTRIGRNGKPFMMYKFRCLVDSDAGRQEAYVRQLVAGDRAWAKMEIVEGGRRMIFGGIWLRAMGLDELPQLWNVLRGEMSWVGPRPCLPHEHVFFSACQGERFRALPGLTGMWQIAGKNCSTFREMVALDIYYVRHATPLMDLAIMLRTPGAVLRQLRRTRTRRTLRMAAGETAAEGRGSKARSRVA